MCKSCEVLVINGVKCHESGCPESYKDEKRVCKWCGYEFIPEDKDQNFCDDSCCCSYWGIDPD